MWYKWCAVPNCKNSTRKTPEKLFINVPKNVTIRNKWLELARRNPLEIQGSSVIFFCEDHFNMETEMANYLKYKMGFSKKVLMVEGVLPSKFLCQHRNEKDEPRSSPTMFIKRGRENLIQKSDIIQPTNEFYIEIDNPITMDLDSRTDAPCEEEVLACRACLATDAELLLYNLHDNGLEEVFADISGFPVQRTDRYPQLICGMCLHALRKLAVFRRRCQSAMYMLQQMEADNLKISTETISQVDHKHTYHLIQTEVNIISIDNNVSTPKEINVDAPDDDDVDDDDIQVKEEIIDEEIATLVEEGNTDSGLPLIEELRNGKLDKIEEAENNFANNNENKDPLENVFEDTVLEVEQESITDKVVRLTFQDCKERIDLKPNVSNKNIRKEKSVIDKLKLKQTKAYICDFCKKSFQNKQLLITHINRHMGRKYRCNICSRSFLEEKYLIIHKKSHTREKSHSCDICHKHLNVKNNLTFMCNMCPKRFSRLAYLTKHKYRHTYKPENNNYKHVGSATKRLLREII